MNDTIFVCGGVSTSSGNPILNSCEQFTASSGTTGDGSWSLVPALLPIPVFDIAMATAAGKLYVIGGVNGSNNAVFIVARWMQTRFG